MWTCVDHLNVHSASQLMFQLKQIAYIIYIRYQICFTSIIFKLLPLGKGQLIETRDHDLRLFKNPLVRFQNITLESNPRVLPT